MTLSSQETKVAVAKTTDESPAEVFREGHARGSGWTLVVKSSKKFEVVADLSVAYLHERGSRRVTGMPVVARTGRQSVVSLRFTPAFGRVEGRCACGVRGPRLKPRVT